MDLCDRNYWETLIGKGAARFFLLAALSRRPMHGYELAKAITIACNGCCEPSDAMIYPAIRELSDGGYIECREEATGARRRNVCHLTEKGREAYRAAAEAWAFVLPCIQQMVKDGLREPVALESERSNQ